MKEGSDGKAVIKGCSASSDIVGLSSKFFTRHSEMKSRKTCDQAVGSLTVGGGFLGIWKRALIGWISDKGGSLSANSIATIPRDQTSHLASYQCYRD